MDVSTDFLLDDALKCGRFDTKDMRDRKTTTGTGIGVVVFNLQSLFQFAGVFFQKECIE